jgi:hypothetical protein
MVVLLIEIFCVKVYTVTSACPVWILERNVFQSYGAFHGGNRRMPVFELETDLSENNLL